VMVCASPKVLSTLSPSHLQCLLAAPLVVVFGAPRQSADSNSWKLSLAGSSFAFYLTKLVAALALH
jgi:hypothetical protein